MNAISITLPDGSVKEYPYGVTGREVAESISPNLAKRALGVKADDTILDLTAPLQNDCTLRILLPDNEDADSLYLLRHSCAHVMAEAVCDLYPGTRLAYGPPIENGFYYDMAIPVAISTEDFPAIERRMQEIIKENRPFTRCEYPAQEGLDRTAQDKYKKDNAERAIAKGSAQISYYSTGTPGDHWEDLCAGPHVPSTGVLKAFKIMAVSGAYWHGDQNSDALTRLTGTCWADNKGLKQYLHFLEEAKKRDHRKIGKEMDLFSFHAEGLGFPFWHPRGMKLYNRMRDYSRAKHLEKGYQEVVTPAILNEDLWRKSGHWDKYRDNMYFTDIDDTAHAVKPMNCPGGLLIYGNDLHSYRELPIRNFEFGQVHRHEKAGVLHGLFRVRMFTQDDAHIFCTPEQIEPEVVAVIDFILETYRDFGFENFQIELSTRPAMRIGEEATWDKAEEALRNALEHKGIDYVLNPGDGAFYGPKIDFHIRDSLNRSWQCGTVQLDFSMPERFGLDYQDKDGEKKRPVMLHRAVFGSFERFLGILLEHYAGDLPLWLHPEQIRVVPVSEKFMDYAEQVQAKLQQHGLYSSVDSRGEKIGYKIRSGEKDKVPYLLIVGEQEAKDGSVSVRKRKIGDQGQMSLEIFLEKVNFEIENKISGLPVQSETEDDKNTMEQKESLAKK
jgi:threonyl-tRNA synthetase